MRVLKCSWETRGASFKHQMLWASCCTCFYSFLHSREATIPIQSVYDPPITCRLTWYQIQEQSLFASKPPRPISFSKVLMYSWAGQNMSSAPQWLLPVYITVHGVGTGPLFHYQDKTSHEESELRMYVR